MEHGRQPAMSPPSSFPNYGRRQPDPSMFLRTQTYYLPALLLETPRGGYYPQPDKLRPDSMLISLLLDWVFIDRRQLLDLSMEEDFQGAFHPFSSACRTQFDTIYLGLCSTTSFPAARSFLEPLPKSVSGQQGTFPQAVFSLRTLHRTYL